MKRYVFLCVCVFFFISFLVACDRGDTIKVDTIIVSKTTRDGTYYFNLEYELDGFSTTLTATEKVTQRVYNQYQVGDRYTFKRPAPQFD